MDPLTIAAAAGTRARLESLDLIANNIANQNTTGYKADMEFYGLYVSNATAFGAQAPDAPAPTELPEIERHWTDYSQGALTATGNPLDIAITGKGYFEVANGSMVRWTRNGNFRIGMTGKLETQQGEEVSVTPPPGVQQVQLNANLPLTVSKDGELFQQGELRGKLVLKAPDSGAPQPQKVGDSYFRPTAPALSVSLPNAAEIAQGYLEGANSSIAAHAVRLVNVLRQFEMLQKATALGADMSRRAIEEVGRVAV